MVKKIFSLFLLFSLVSAAFTFGGTEAMAANMDVWVESSLAGVFKDDVKAASSETRIDLVAAKNEYESAQILLRSSVSFSIASVTFSNLVSGSNTIEGSNLRYNFVDYIYLDHNSSDIIGQTRNAPAYFPEYLLNDTARNVPANTTQPVWVTAYIPKAAFAGTYTGTVTVNTSAGSFPIGISIEVANVEIPDAANAGYTVSNWSFLSGWEDQADQIAIQYGYTRYSPQWWSLMDKIAVNMKEHRINQLWVQTIGLLLDGGSTVGPDGTISFNWSRFDEFIQFFMDRGAVKGLESGHLMLKDDSGNYCIWGLKRNSAGDTVIAKMPYGSNEANRFAGQYLAQLKAHLQSKEWLDKWYLSIGDEPNTESMEVTWRAAYDDLVSVYAPGMKVLNAFYRPLNEMTDTYEGRLFCWVPILNIVDQNMSYFQSRQDLGEEFWDYVCVGPSGEYYNRFIDMPLSRIRMHQWYNYNNGITGTLHWAWNFWPLPNDTAATPGDNAIVYPDSANGTVRNTLRYEALRDGAEEYELFKILETGDSSLAHKLANAVSPNAKNPPTDIRYLEQKHRQLVRAAAGQTAGDPTLDAFSLIDAENFSETSGVYRELCTDQVENQNICGIHNGDYVAYDSVDFGTGALGAEFRVASEVNGGDIEIRLDDLNGPLIGTVKVPVTGGWQTWSTRRISVGGVSGIHKVYLKFVNTATQLGLMNVNWFKFTRYDNNLEAENAALAGGAAVMTYPHSGYTGAGFVDGYWNPGASTTFTVDNIEAGGGYCVDLRYSNKDAARTLSLYVNGAKIKQISLATTPDWDSWTIRKDFIHLNAGANTITYKYDEGDTGNINIDHIQLFPLSLSYRPGTDNAVASSVQGEGYEAVKATDGNWGSRWSSDFSDLQWIYVDLGSARSVSRVCITWEDAYGKSYRIQISNDATSWTDVYSTTQGNGGIDEINISPVDARYVRIYGTERGTSYGYSIWELEVN